MQVAKARYALTPDEETKVLSPAFLLIAEGKTFEEVFKEVGRAKSVRMTHMGGLRCVLMLLLVPTGATQQGDAALPH